MNFKNKKLNILITGASGMLGLSLASSLMDKHNIFGTGSSDLNNVNFNYLKFDLLNQSYNELIKWCKPDLIIHCAAITDADYCENNPWDALNVNGFSVKKLIDSTKDYVKIIFISTDAVFNDRTHMANESDLTSPENIYGKSKELAEFFLQNSNREFLILRTTIVGLNEFTQRKGFLEWIINSVKSKKAISLFDDVLFTPISIWDFIKEINFIIENDLINSRVFHLSGSEAITKYEFGLTLIKKLSLDTNYILKGRLINNNFKAKRANNQTLDSLKYEKEFNRKLPNIRQTIISIINRYNYEIKY
jgi:dTDP-4-dehydrorhamnose reductase